ncbi:MAG TPA: hypothetical protein VFR06_03035 [Gallionellaceae bacterium]|nr:hypothetical protein [Gallionellaceae bacterium]
MTFASSDFAHIRLSLITFLAVLAIGGSAVYFAQSMADSAHRARQDAQRQLTEARNKYNVARDDRDNLSTYAAEYDSWVKRKVIGDELRLDLIEDLEALRKQNLVLDFKYTIAPQQAYKPEPALDSSNFELRQSGMKLQLELLHEGQLINFFDSLNKRTKGWFMLDDCALSRANIPSSPMQLKAECTGIWLTLKNRSAR